MSAWPELPPAVSDLQGRACALLQPSATFALATDVQTFNHPPKQAGGPAARVLAAIAVPGASVVLAIDAAEFGRFPAVEIANAMGIPSQQPLSAADRANMDYLASLGKKK